MWMSVLLVVGSLLAVVVGDAMITGGQVSLTTTQSQVDAAATAQAESQGLVAPTTVVDLPQVPLNVPLPVPQTAAPPAPANQ
jgi:hypothetical protein